MTGRRMARFLKHFTGKSDGGKGGGGFAQLVLGAAVAGFTAWNTLWKGIAWHCSASLASFASRFVSAVESGQRGILFNRFSGIKEDVYGEGWHCLIPWLEYPILLDVRLKPMTCRTAAGRPAPTPALMANPCLHCSARVGRSESRLCTQTPRICRLWTWVFAFCTGRMCRSFRDCTPRWAPSTASVSYRQS